MMCGKTHGHRVGGTEMYGAKHTPATDGAVAGIATLSHRESEDIQLLLTDISIQRGRLFLMRNV
jgi:hypothetical protein